MAILGTLLKNRRAGEAQLAWNLPGLAAPQTLALTSTAFGEGEAIPARHAGRRAGGDNLSPDLAWTGVPDDTARLLLVIEDADSPSSRPFVHCVAVIDPSRPGVSPGELAATGASGPVQVLKSTAGTGYLGPGPLKGHGAHRYVFQLFALAADLPAELGGTALREARPATVLAAAGPALARARLTGSYER